MSIEDVRVEEEELEAIKRSVLISSRRILVDNIDPAYHLSYLRSKFVLSERDAEEINAPSSRSARAEVFLDKLGRKGSAAYDEFQNSLFRDRTQLFLLTSMTKALELLRYRVKELKVQQIKEFQREKEQQKMKVLQPTQRFYHPQRPNCYPMASGYSSPPSNGTTRAHYQQFTPTSNSTTHSVPTQHLMFHQPPGVLQRQRGGRYCQNGPDERSGHQQRGGIQYPLNFAYQQSSHHQYNNQHHLHHQHHPRHPQPTQLAPPFQSRDPTADDYESDFPTNNKEQHFRGEEEAYPQGPPCDFLLSSDIPCGQPCTQPS